MSKKLILDGVKVLTELFNRPYRMRMVEKYKTEGLSGGFGLLNVVSTGRTEDGREIYIQFLGEPFSPNRNLGYDVEVYFQVDDSDYITKEGDAFRIFSTVIDQMEEFDEKYKGQIAALNFRSVDESRSRLYSTMVRRFASKNNYSYQVDVDSDGMHEYYLFKDR